MLWMGSSLWSNRTFDGISSKLRRLSATSRSSGSALAPGERSASDFVELGASLLFPNRAIRLSVSHQRPFTAHQLLSTNIAQRETRRHMKFHSSFSGRLFRAGDWCRSALNPDEVFAGVHIWIVMVPSWRLTSAS